MKKINKKKKIILSSIGIFIFLFLLIWILLPAEDVVFSFNYELTDEKIDGEVLFDNQLIGNTINGEIGVAYLEEMPKELTFKGEYNGTNFELLYDFPEDYWEYSSYEFLVDEINDKVELYFYNFENNCSLSGEIYFGDKLIGESIGGIFELSKESYQNFWEGEIKIKGVTDLCFGRNDNLPFVEYWTIEDLDYYFETGEEVIFETDFNPRWPVYSEAMQGFIRPSEVEERYSRIKINENNSDLENLERIFAYGYMNYVSDKGRFGETEYWQTPYDFIESKGGDCEDWAIYMESLIKRYSSSLDCYLAVWYTHANILCNLNQTFIILDQDKVRKNLVLDKDLSLQDNQVKTRTWRNDYFEEFGISPDERILYYLINEGEIIEFENGQGDFVDWVLEKGNIN